MVVVVKYRHRAIVLLASHAGVFRGVRFSSLPTKGRDERRAPLKTPAWEAIAESTNPSILSLI